METTLVSYNLLNEISTSLLNLGNDNEILASLNERTDQIKNSLSNDFFTLFGVRLSFNEVKIYYDDVDYRQSATGVFFKANIENEIQFNLTIECLIDFGKILLRIKHVPENLENHTLAKKIKKVCNAEEQTELKNCL